MQKMSIFYAVLSKFVGLVGTIEHFFYACPTKNVRVPDQMSVRKI